MDTHAKLKYGQYKMEANIKNDRNSSEGVGEGRGVGWWTEGGGKREWQLAEGMKILQNH